MAKKIIIQNHHISYNPEYTVRVTRAEHFELTRLSRYKQFSIGFIKGNIDILNKHLKNAKEL